jgi:hypothetical protein
LHDLYRARCPEVPVGCLVHDTHPAPPDDVPEQVLAPYEGIPQICLAKIHDIGRGS